MYDPIPISMLAVQGLALAGLIWYAFETRWMREAAQEQVKVSQDLINAAMDQVEGLSKPCLTLRSRLRDASDAILEMNGAVGNTEASGDQGRFVLQNIGNGVALNVSYRFEHLNSIDAPPRAHRARYVQNVLAGQNVTMAEPMGAYAGGYNLIFCYESIGGRKYKTTVTMHHYVLTELKFQRLPLVANQVA